MALNMHIQLSHTEGLQKIIVFSGLSHDVVIHPTIHGEPLLTIQAFYYLEQMEAIAEIRFENEDDHMSEQEIDYLIDNYLFEYSKIDSKSKMTTKVTRFKYWTEDYSNMYLFYDQKNTKALALDIGNDDSVLSIESIDKDDGVDFLDWCLIKNYSNSIFDSYLRSMANLINKKVMIRVAPTDDRDGYFGKARLVKCDYGLINYYQAQKVDDINIRDIEPGATSIDICSSDSQTVIESLPIQRIILNKLYNPILLSYYFLGLREDNPLLSFVGFYNVIEYYFEEAPTLLNKSSQYEVEQIKCVIELLAKNEDIASFFESRDDNFKKKLALNIQTSSGIEIFGFNPQNNNDHISELGRWLYDIRCAIVHSKKTRKGKRTAIFEPYSSCTENIKIAVPIVKWLAILCIEKDYELGLVEEDGR